MLIAYIPALVSIIGLLIYVLSSKPKVERIGEHMFWTGLLVTLFTVASHVVKLP